MRYAAVSLVLLLSCLCLACAPKSVPAPTATPTNQQRVQDILSRLDAPWAAHDWDTAITLLRTARTYNPNSQLLADKLYAAYYNAGKQLEASGDCHGAETAYFEALGVEPNGVEAKGAIRALSCITFGPPQPPVAFPPAASSVQFVFVQGGSPGDTASTSVQTAPAVRCDIVYVTPSGTVGQAKGLTGAVADDSGRAWWSWVIAKDSLPGTGTITVYCNGGTATANITILP